MQRLGNAGAAAEVDAETAERMAEALRIEVQRVLDDLQQQGLLSDSRAAEALMQAKAPRYGQRRLAQLLQQRAFSAELAAESLEQIRHTETDRAREVWRRRFGQPPADLRERARQHRFLAARGFDGHVIERVIKEAMLQAGDGDGMDPSED